MKKVLSIILAATLSLSLAGCGEKPVSSATGSNTLKVGMECAYAPFNWTQTDDSNGAVKLSDGSYANGYDVQIAKKVAADMGLELEIVKTEWDGLLPSLTSGKLDLIIAGMSATEERKQSIDFSDNYYQSELVIVVDKDGKYANATKLADFSGAKLTGQLNTFHDSVIDQIEGVEHLTAMEDFPSMVVALQSGKIDGYVSEQPGAIAAQKANPELVFSKLEDGFVCNSDDTAIAIGLIKGSELTANVNAALATIDQATRDELMNEAVENQPLSK